MDCRPVLFFDSGIGGLSVLRETRYKVPERQFIYYADDRAFPYGNWQEDRLKKHIIAVFKRLLKRHNPIITVIACNTASTLVLTELRQIFPDHRFVGTVPAIKPAAEKSRSKLFTVLATPSTVKRTYTRDLIAQHAHDCRVNMVGSRNLAEAAEHYLRGEVVDFSLVQREIAPCFIEEDGRHTDIVVLACTHYPFLINVFRQCAPWPVDWFDPAEAIAKRVRSLLPVRASSDIATLPEDLALFTSETIGFATARLLHGFGLKHLESVDS